MSDVSFILVYVDDVAASEAFYTSILGRGAIELLAYFRHASRRAGPDAGAMEAWRSPTSGERGGRRRDRLHRGGRG